MSSLSDIDSANNMATHESQHHKRPLTIAKVIPVVDLIDDKVKPRDLPDPRKPSMIARIDRDVDIAPVNEWNVEILREVSELFAFGLRAQDIRSEISREVIRCQKNPRYYHCFIREVLVEDIRAVKAKYDDEHRELGTIFTPPESEDWDAIVTICKILLNFVNRYISLALVKDAVGQFVILNEDVDNVMEKNAWVIYSMYKDQYHQSTDLKIAKKRDNAFQTRKDRACARIAGQFILFLYHRTGIKAFPKSYQHLIPALRWSSATRNHQREAPRSLLRGVRDLPPGVEYDTKCLRNPDTGGPCKYWRAMAQELGLDQTVDERWEHVTTKYEVGVVEEHRYGGVPTVSHVDFAITN